MPTPMLYGAATVLGSHSCGALSPVTASGFYYDMLEAQSDKLKALHTHDTNLTAGEP